jgi:uncharacterized protein YegP (UPF0339 family)
MAGTFEIYPHRHGGYGFRLRSRAGVVVATGPSFESRDAAKRGIAAVLVAAAGSTIVPDPDLESASRHHPPV